jgi:hypothetical protein
VTKKPSSGRNGSRLVEAADVIEPVREIVRRGLSRMAAVFRNSLRAIYERRLM